MTKHVHLSDDLLARVKARAGDPERRTDNGGLMSQGEDLGIVMGGAPQLGEAFASFQPTISSLKGLLEGLGVPTPFGSPGAHPSKAPPRSDALPEPTGDSAIRDAEAALGFALPAPLRQLYECVADGGFGPGDGLFGIDRLIGEYREVTAEPPGPGSQLWPANLLPLVDLDPGYSCLDVESGRIVRWDPEELEGSNDTYWRRSFSDEAADLGAWLEQWLGAPTAMERMREIRHQAMREQVEQTRTYYAGMSAAERMQHGLPETGWESALNRRFGLED